MFANIKSGKFSFPSPFWDHVSEEAKVSRPSHLFCMHLKTSQLDSGFQPPPLLSCISDTGFHWPPVGGCPTEALLFKSDATTLLAKSKHKKCISYVVVSNGRVSQLSIQITWLLSILLHWVTGFSYLQLGQLPSQPLVDCWLDPCRNVHTGKSLRTVHNSPGVSQIT